MLTHELNGQVLTDTNGPRDALRHNHCAIKKLDAECDRQATVVGRLLTTLGDKFDVPSRNYS